MIVGALLNPLHQNGARMVAATLCTQSQLEDGMRRLTNFVKEFYEKGEGNDVDLNSGGGRSISMMYLQTPIARVAIPQE